mmetsp:Transcript_11323/g.21817  ORF Transcript_11323/g.21817 Transcript_11323/m.21817 type:complete len:297 (+) Transcript_11323:586-1476(+)
MRAALDAIQLAALSPPNRRAHFLRRSEPATSCPSNLTTACDAARNRDSFAPRTPTPSRRKMIREIERYTKHKKTRQSESSKHALKSESTARRNRNAATASVSQRKKRGPPLASTFPSTAPDDGGCEGGEGKELSLGGTPLSPATPKGAGLSEPALTPPLLPLGASDTDRGKVGETASRRCTMSPCLSFSLPPSPFCPPGTEAEANDASSFSPRKRPREPASTTATAIEEAAAALDEGAEFLFLGLLDPLRRRGPSVSAGRDSDRLGGGGGTTTLPEADKGVSKGADMERESWRSLA